jgi:hypothetical protein
MKERSVLFWLLAVIAVITVLTGGGQVLMPGEILRLLKTDETPVALQLFGTIGMFMVLFGALMLNALFGPTHQPVAVFWASLQKLGASVAVGIGVLHGTFSTLGWGVAGMDLVSGILGLWYWIGLPK